LIIVDYHRWLQGFTRVVQCYGYVQSLVLSGVTNRASIAARMSQ